MGGGDSPSEASANKYTKELWTISKEKWDDYKTRFLPYENKWIADVTAANPEREAEVKGQVNADVAQNKPIGIKQGQDTSVGSAMKAITSETNTGSKSAKAMSGAGMAARNQQVQGLKAAIDIGRGQSTDAQLGFGNLASMATKQSINSVYDQASDYNSRQNTVNTAGSAIGAAANLMMNRGGGSDKKQSDSRWDW